ncbi:MAG: outer membrane beta-barrel protein, partial [Crocinitomicaceae bacterium]|nr:outer membrane beta-barrel protein [Crocinitomicaceae bacterium]
MKKNSILTIVLLAGLAAAAQTSKFKIAFRVSPNLSWAKPDDNNIESGKTVFRFGYGVMLDRMFSDNYAFGTGFEICQTGGMLVYKGSGKVNNEDRIWETTRTYNTKYIEIPLTLKLRTNEIGYITYWGQFGLGLGFNIRSRADEKVDYLLDRVSQDGVWSWQASNNENL